MDSENLRLSNRIKKNENAIAAQQMGSFLGLTDTPESYSSHSNKLLSVNDSADGISFSHVTGSGTLMPIGSMLMWTSSTIPDGWLLCDGSAVLRTTYADLYSAVGTTYGIGDGSTTFNLPNLKGRFPVGLNGSDTDFDSLGETGGAKTHTLTQSEMPSHSHTVDPPETSTGNVESDTVAETESKTTITEGEFSGVSVVSDVGFSSTHHHDVDIPQFNSGSTGSGNAHNNVPPYITVNFIINYQDVKIPFKGDTGAAGATGATGSTGPAGTDGADGADAPQIQYQFSADGAAWHSSFTAEDAYIRFSADGGSTWGDSIHFKGDTGDTGDTGAVGVSMRSLGPWDSSTQYVNNSSYIDVVENNGSSYACKTTHTNEEPPSAAYWDLLAGKGADGTGTGDVSGPSSSTDEHIAVFDSTTGKVLQDGGKTISELMLTIYPVGSVYISASSANPSSLFGGTWAAFGEGRALVGFKSGDSDFGTAEGTSGSKAVALTTSEMPSHTHTQNSHTHSISHNHSSATSSSSGSHGHSIWWGSDRPISLSSGSKTPPANTYSSSGYRTGYASGSVYEWAMNAKSNGSHTHTVDLPSYSGNSGSATATNQSAGSGSAHNNIQPSVTVYMWKRTA